MSAYGLTVLIVTVICAAWIVVTWFVLRRFDGSHQAPRRFSSLGAWGTRARRSAMRSVYRRAGTTLTWAQQAIASRIQGLRSVWADRNAGRFDSALGSPVTGHASADAAGLPTLAGPTDLPDGGGPLSPAPVRQPETADPDHPAPEGGLKADMLPDGGGLVPSSAPVRQPTRKATGAEARWYLTPAERHATPLDYAPAPPFASVLSPDTLARGIPAVKP